MSKKTNSLSLRSIQNKSWASSSFFNEYNYSKLLYQDLYIQNYVKNFLRYNVPGSLIHDINIQRRKSSIYIFLDYYSLDDKFSNNKGFSKKKSTFNNGNNKLSFVKKKKRALNKHISFVQKDPKRYFLKKKFYSLYRSVVRKKENPYQKYLLKKLPYRGKQTKLYHRVMLARLKLSKDLFLPFFGLKRLLIANLVLLTDCKVSIFTRNIAEFSRLPLFSPNNKRNLNKTDGLKSVTDIKNAFKIRGVPSKVKNLDIFKLIHLFYTSIVFNNPGLLGSFLSEVLKRNIKVFNLFFFFISYVLSIVFNLSNLSGLKIQFKGRLGSSLRKKVSVISFGSMPLQKLNSSIKYSFNESFTIYGICGIKVWYYY